MDGIDQDDVIRIMNVLEASTFDELHLEMGDLKLVVSKSGQTTRAGEQRTPHRVASAETEIDVKAPIQEREKAVEASQEPNVERDDLIAIKSPMLGTFYRAPKPGAPPFVKENDVVSEDDSVCIIEVMKLFNTIKANVPGRIVKICAENGKMVEYQQTLFLLEPLEEDTAGKKDQGS